MLHPDLSRLQERYNEVLDEYEAGNISYEDALATVQAMSVVDGSGFIWIIDSVSGSFLRAVPGESPVETDPSEFAPARIPAPGSAPWASQQDLLRPPHRPGPAGMDQYPAGPQQYPNPNYPQNYPQGYDQETGEELYTPMMNRRSSKPSASSSVIDAVKNVKLPPLLERNKKILAIALAMVVLLFAVMFFKKDETVSPTIPPTTAAPVSPPATQPVDTTQPAATLPPESTTPAPSPNDPVPSNPEISALLADLTSGDRLKVSAAVLNKKDDVSVVLFTARYKGYDATSIGIAVYAPYIEKGKVFSEVRLVDKSSNTELAVRKVRWVRDPAGRWVWNAFVDFES